MKIHWKKVLLAAALFTIISQAIHTAGAWLGMGFYTEPEYFPVWSKLMMPAEGPPPASFMFYSLGFGFVSAFIYAMFYDFVKPVLKDERKVLQKGLIYGFGLFVVCTVPNTLTMLLLVNLPAGLLMLWTAEMLASFLLGGMVVAKVMK